MDDNMKFCIQIAYLNQLASRELLTEKEYEKIKTPFKRKIYGRGLAPSHNSGCFSGKK